MPYLHQEIDIETREDLLSILKLIAASSSNPEKVLAFWDGWEQTVVKEGNETSFTEWMSHWEHWTREELKSFRMMESIFRVVLHLQELRKELDKSNEVIRSIQKAFGDLLDHELNNS